MKAAGVTDAQIHTMLVDNPRRLFTRKIKMRNGAGESAILRAAVGLTPLSARGRSGLWVER